MTAMSSTIPENYVTYLSVRQTVNYPISTLSAMYFAYGIYVLLFGIYVYMMRSRNQTGERQNGKLYSILTVVLFLLSMIFVATYTVYYVNGAVVRFNVVKNKDYDLFERYQNYDDLQRRLGSSAEGFLAVFLNVAAEWMLIHRCYIIWGSNKLVAVPLIMASTIINACGFASYILESIGIANLATHNPNASSLLVLEPIVEDAYLIASAVHNLVITLLTAGRIWWIHRQIHAQGVYTSDKLVQSISRLILESGMIYPFMNVVDLVILNTIPPEKYIFDPFPLVVLSAGIAPTLIMVRAKLGMNIESTQEAVSEIRFTSQPAQRGAGGTSTVYSQAQVLSIAPNSEGGMEGGEERAGNAKVTFAIA